MRAILFDLDGTLLDIDIGEFMSRYLSALARYTATAFPEDGVMDAVYRGTDRMMRPHPGETNRDVFYAEVRALTGIDLNERWDVFERFYQEHFDTLQDSAGPSPGAHEAVDTARDLGLKIALATNPLFPASAVERRMAWAGFFPEDFDLVTTWETLRACKPHAAYYHQTADILGVEPSECVMVGDDIGLDLAAADVGMQTFYVGETVSVSADWIGDLSELARLLPRLARGSATASS